MAVNPSTLEYAVRCGRCLQGWAAIVNVDNIPVMPQCPSCAAAYARGRWDQPENTPAASNADVYASAEYVVTDVWPGLESVQLYDSFPKAAEHARDRRRKHCGHPDQDTAKQIRVLVAKVVAEAEPPAEPEIKIKDLRGVPEDDSSYFTPLHILSSLPQSNFANKRKLRPFLKPEHPKWWIRVLDILAAAVLGAFVVLFACAVLDAF